MKIERFEDIQAWQKARQLVTRIYSMTNKGDFAKDYGSKDQLRRASVSVMSNTSEGYARQTDKEFAQFLYIALGSAAEVQSLLYTAQDLNYIAKEEFDNIYKLSSEVAHLIAGFIKYLQGSQK